MQSKVTKAIQTDRPLLQAAIAAVERNDLRGANALFLEHLAKARTDPKALVEYGVFCLRTGRHGAASYLLRKAIEFSAPDAEVLTQLGFARLEAGDAVGSQRSFEAALEHTPAHPLTNFGLAQYHLHVGSWDAAIACFRLALVEQPGNLSVLLNLADTYHKAGDTIAAAAEYECAHHLAPNDPVILLEYGKFLREQRMFAQALQFFSAFRQVHPDEPIGMLEIARCYRAMGEIARALESLEHLNQMATSTPEYHEELGNCLTSPADLQKRDLHWGLAADMWIKAQQFSLAEPVLKKMLGACPSYAVTWNLKGILHEAQQQLELAEAAFKRAIELDPQWLDPSANLTNLYERTNRLSSAKLVGEAALEPDTVQKQQQQIAYVSLLLALVKIARREKDYARAAQLLDRMNAGQNETQRRIEIFERGKLYDLIGNQSAAIEAFNRGNALARIAWKRDNLDDKYLGWVEYAIGLEKSGWSKTWHRIEEQRSEAEPAFLVGFPRSGTTLLNQILDCHSSVQALEEKRTVSEMLGAVHSMPEGYPHALAVCDQFDIDYLREAYFNAVSEHVTLDPNKLLIDKLPLNLTKACLIHRVFPRARFILALRHPCDVVLSCFMQDFHVNDAMANFFTLKDTVALYVRTMELWELFQRDLELSVHQIRYEDLVDDLEGRTRSLCDFLGLPWQAELKQFATKALDRGKINTPSYEQVSKPIYREARYRWERYREHLAPYLPTLQPYIERFGYSDAARSA
jgi:Tfp pilus assembly protein PilF